jgi:hypothetical protein
VWSSIDINNSGYIEANELRIFLEKCLKNKKKEIPDEKIEDYASAIVSKY